MADINAKTAFQLGADSLSRIIHPRKHSQAVDERINGNCSFLEAFNSKIERAAVLSEEDSQDVFSALLQEIKFSDPISVAEAVEDEKRLLVLADELLLAVENGEAVTDELIEKARKLLLIRNKTCKQAK